MLGGELFFEKLEFLEPHCPTCDAKLDYGTTTRYDDRLKGHVCLGCNTFLR